MADLLEELTEVLVSHFSERAEPINLTLDKIHVPPPVVNVSTPPAPQPIINLDPVIKMTAPSVHVPAPVVHVPAPVINVDVPALPKSWTFTVQRNKDGLIQTMTAKPS